MPPRAWLLATAALVFLAALLAWESVRDYRVALEQEYRLLESHAHIADARVQGILRSTDQLFRELALERRKLRHDGAAAFRAGLARQMISLPELRALFFTDAAGRIDISTDARVLGFDVSAREYFRAAQAAAAPRLIVSRPFRGALDVMIVIVVRPIHDAQGRFAGVVGASLDPQYFEDILNTPQAGPTGSNLIVNADGDILYAAPEAQRLAGQSLAGDTAYEEHRARGEAMTRHRGDARLTPPEKLSVSRRIGDSGLIAVVSQNVDAVLAPWRHSLLARLAILLAALGVIALVAHLAWRRSAERDAMEAQLREREAQLSKAQAVAHLGSWQLDIAHKRLTGSDETYRLFGIAPETPLSVELFLERVHADDRGLVGEAWQAALRGAACDVEHRIVVDGRSRWVRACAEVAFDGAGQAVGATGTVQDVSERKRAELQLRLAATVFENSREGVTITDLERKIISVNPAFCEITGYAPAEVIGQDPRVLQSGRQDGAFYRAMWESINACGYWHGEIWNRRKNGEIYPELLSIAVVRDRLGKPLHYIGVFTDISALKRSEEEVRLLNADLELRVRERTAALESSNRELESFSYSVSHDLRGPLRAIDGFSHVIAEEYGAALGEDGRACLARVRAASQRMGELIDHLLDLAKVSRQALRRERVDLSRLAADRARAIGAADPAGRADWQIEPGIVATGDAALLGTALDNLLYNAWKFTAGARAAGTAHIAFGCAAGDDGVTYFVRDNGIGIDMTYADKLFRPFQRLHPPGEFAGSGIGLAIVDRIIRRHGGTLRAESAPGRGTTIYFTLG